MRSILRGLLVALLAICGVQGHAQAQDPAPNRIAWQPWETPTFERAKTEGRTLLLVVSTSWCHWCHVMQRETYADPRVEAALARGFVAVKVDADDRPDLAERFRKYRWPATAFYSPTGEPILALRGYRSAEELLKILADVEARVRRGGPFTGFETAAAPRAPQVDPDDAFLEDLRVRLVRQLDATYDTTHQGWGKGQKYPLAEPVLWGLRRALTDPKEVQPLRRAMDTLAASEALLDPVFGGMFQYSVGPDWKEPHYEKIMGVNAGALEAFSRAYALSGNERWKRAAESVKRWFERFLSAPDGAFYTSQDAEVGGREATAYHRLGEAGRLAIGVPRVDTNVYARENGQAIQAYVAYALATGDAAALARAKQAANRVLDTHFDGARRLVRHDAGGRGGRFYLLDQADFGLGLLALSQAAGDWYWLPVIESLALGLQNAFGAEGGGYYDVTEDVAAQGALAERTRSLEGQAQIARLLVGASALAGIAGPGLRKDALRAIAAVSDPAYLADHWRDVGALLLAVEGALARPTLVSLHAHPDSAAHTAFLEVVRRAQARDPALWVRGVEPWMGQAGPRPAPFAVVCAPDGSCSDPLETALALEAALVGR